MIKHVVCFKLKDPTPDNINRAAELLRGMNGQIPELQFLEVGVDFARSERSFDLVLISHFNSKEDLDIYATHPIHLPVLKYVKDVSDKIIAVDYEV